jgi:hypothetical protein
MERLQGRVAVITGAATSQVSYTAAKGGVLALTREVGVQLSRELSRARRSSARPHPVGPVPRCRSSRQIHRRAAAATKASNNLSSAMTSGCHCTPSTNGASGSSHTSMLSSSAQPVTVRLPASATA